MHLIIASASVVTLFTLILLILVISMRKRIRAAVQLIESVCATRACVDRSVSRPAGNNAA